MAWLEEEKKMEPTVELNKHEDVHDVKQSGDGGDNGVHQ